MWKFLSSVVWFDERSKKEETLKIDTWLCDLVIVVRRNKSKFEMLVPDFHKFAHTLKIRVGIWTQEMLGFADFSPHNFMHNLEAILL